MKLTVLIADDETMPRITLRDYLPWGDFSVDKVVLASDGQEALELAKEHHPDIIISDMKMPHLNGLELAAAVRDFLPSCQFIFLSGYTDKEYLKGAIKLKAASYVEKPIDLDEITNAIREVVADLQHDFLADPKFLFFRGETQNTEALNSQEYLCDKSLLRQLENNIRQVKQDDTLLTLNTMLSDIKECEGTSPDYIRHLYRQIIFMFLHAAESQNIQSIISQTDSLLYTGAKQPTLNQLWDTLLQTAQIYFSSLLSSDQDITSKVDRFLEKNYGNAALTVQEVADNLGFTYTYLCSAYKKSCGKTVNQRLTEIRVQNAKELLTSTNKKLYEVANAVGYADGKYFVKVFTRETGLSPKQYRERHAYEE